jgi:hypothetical protein
MLMRVRAVRPSAVAVIVSGTGAPLADAGMVTGTGTTTAAGPSVPSSLTGTDAADQPAGPDTVTWPVRASGAWPVTMTVTVPGWLAEAGAPTCAVTDRVRAGGPAGRVTMS